MFLFLCYHFIIRYPCLSYFLFYVLIFTGYQLDFFNLICLLIFKYCCLFVIAFYKWNVRISFFPQNISDFILEWKTTRVLTVLNTPILSKKHISRSDIFPMLSRSEHILLFEDDFSVLLKIILLNEDLSK